MFRTLKGWKTGLTAILMTLVATPAFARSVDLKDAGVVLWIFVAMGALIILLQLVPAIILFFSFIGTASGVAFRGKRVREEGQEKAPAPGMEPAPVKP